MDSYEHEGRGYDDAPRDYRRDERSLSPRRDSPRRERNRSASPARGEARSAAGDDDRRTAGADEAPRGPPPEAQNPGTNLFVTGIHPRLTEEDVTRLFSKYGEVKKCQIMVDPHTKESRGFGFVEMMTLEQADNAKEGLQGEIFEGRTLSIEKARRSRPRTPTPGKYFGPPKRDADERGSGRGGGYRGGYRDDDRGGYGRRRYDDEYPRGGGGGYRSGGGGGGYDRYDDRDRGDRYYSRDNYGGPPRGADRYRDDRYGPDRRAPRETASYGYPDRDTASYGRAPAGDVPSPAVEARGGYGDYREERYGRR